MKCCMKLAVVCLSIGHCASDVQIEFRPRMPDLWGKLRQFLAPFLHSGGVWQGAWGPAPCPSCAPMHSALHLDASESEWNHRGSEAAPWPSPHATSSAASPHEIHARRFARNACFKLAFCRPRQYYGIVCASRMSEREQMQVIGPEARDRGPKRTT